MSIERSVTSLARIEQIRYTRPPSIVTEIDVVDTVPAVPMAAPPAVVNDPVLAVLDGVPMAGHLLLQPQVSVEDLFGLEPNTLVTEHVHGSAMASLIVHGDRNRPEPPLPRQIHCIPVLGAGDRNAKWRK
jgi:hypothetical protein